MHITKVRVLNTNKKEHFDYEMFLFMLQVTNW